MNKTVLGACLLITAFFGIADSWYLAETALSGDELVCTIDGLDKCNTVAKSEYSHLFGVPLGVYGVFFYSAFFILTAISFFVPKRYVYQTLYGLGFVGVGASVIFILIQLFLIKAFCIYCIASAVIAFALWFLARSLYKRFAPSKTPVVA
jgi:uncharacterized membrane protein